MMTERQRKFREQFVAQISPWYNGVVHVLVTFGVGIAAIAWCLSRMQDARWEWLLLIPVAWLLAERRAFRRDRDQLAILSERILGIAGAGGHRDGTTPTPEHA